MKTKVWKAMAMVLAVTMLAGIFAACAKTEPVSVAETTKAEESAQTQSETPKLEPAEIKMALWGDKPNDLDAVLAEFEKRTQDTLNVKLDISWTPLGDYANKVKLMLSAGEELDCAFDAQWLQMINLISQKNYLELDGYFNNSKYAGLSSAFSKEMLENNKFSGHIYGVPFSQGYGEVGGIYVRKDLREKYGLPKISSLAELETYFEKVKQNEPGVVPIAENGSGANWFHGFMQENQVMFSQANIYGTGLGAGVSANFVLDGSGKKVEKVVFSMEEDPTIKVKWDTGPLARDWYVKGYFEKDVISQKDKVGMFKAGKAAAIAWDTANFNAVANDLKKAVPGAEMELFVTNEQVRNFQPKAMLSEFKAWNFACIPVNSKKADRTMMFFDWLFSDKANHDLFEYGIEGKHWTAEGEDKYRVPEGGATYSFPGYQLTWNTNMVRYPSGIDEDVLNYLKYRSKDDTYFMSPLAGFSFDQEPVKSEMAKVGPVFDMISNATIVGILDDPKAQSAKAVEKAKKLGLEKIREEAKKQVEAFLATK